MQDGKAQKSGLPINQVLYLIAADAFLHLRLNTSWMLMAGVKQQGLASSDFNLAS